MIACDVYASIKILEIEDEDGILAETGSANNISL
jgi:hypothetical protein